MTNSDFTSGTILVVSRTFFPKEGGIEEYVYVRCLQDDPNVILLTPSLPHSSEFDDHQKFKIYRWPSFYLPGFTGSLFKQVNHLIFSFIFPILLFFKHKYISIEWAHGYDFTSLLLLSYILPVKFVIYLHGNDLLCPLRNGLFSYLFRLTLLRMNIIVCNSQFTADLLQEKFSYISKNNIFVINPVLRPQKFSAKVINPSSLSPVDNASLIREKYNIPKESIIILHVGRLVKRKGCQLTLNVIPQLIKEGIDVHYIICGRGPYEPLLRDLASDLRIDDRVHFAGFVNDSDLSSYYLTSNIFVMPTFYDQDDQSIEGFGIVYREAGYFGLPVIASRIGGTLDAVHHNVNGLLITPGSLDELSSAISILSTDSQLRTKLGQSGMYFASMMNRFNQIYV